MYMLLLGILVYCTLYSMRDRLIDLIGGYHHWLRVSSCVINHCRNVRAFIMQAENEFESVGWPTLDAYYETITRQGIFAGNLVLAFVMVILYLRRFYRHCKVVLTGVSGVVILQTGSSFQFCRGNVSLSITALCHAGNLPELETWFRDIIIAEWERGKLDNSTLEFWGL